jgi:hypothetical protein
MVAGVLALVAVARHNGINLWQTITIMRVINMMQGGGMAGGFYMGGGGGRFGGRRRGGWF